MAVDCKKTRRLLDGYHDRQLRGRKFDEVGEHLRWCEGCSKELERLERISSVLKQHYEGAVGAEDFSRMWAGVDAAVRETASSPSESLLDRLAAILWIPKPAWAVVVAAAIVIVMVFAYLPDDRQAPVLAANDCIIDSVDAQDCSVMVYEVGDSKMKVIWIMDQQLPPAGEEA